MAVTAREVIMVFRGQNYLSSAIRRVGRDVGMLGRTQQLATQRAQLQIVQQRLAQTRAIAAAEQVSVTRGSRRIALDQRRASLTAKEIEDHQRLQRIYSQQNANLEQRLRLQTRSEQVTTAASGGVRRGFTKSLTNEQLVREAQAIKVAQARNLADMETLERARIAAITTIGNQSIASQKLAADEAALSERNAQLTQQINNTTRAMELNTAKLEQNALAIRRLPWERFQAGAQMVEHAGRALQMFGLIGTAAFGILAKNAAEFGTQATLAATQAIEPGRNSVMQIQKISAALQKGVLDILQSGTSVGQSDELTKSAYDILSGITQLSDKSAVKIRQTLGLLREFNLVTKANFGLVTFNQATQAGITLMNSFGTTFRQLPHEFDVMQKAVNRGRITMGQFIDGLNQTAAPAKAAGFTFDQMAATLSFLSTKFPNYNRAAVGYARLTEMLANPKFIGGLRKAGVSITDLSGKHLLPLDQIIQRLTKRFPDLQKGGIFVQNFFKRFSGQTGFIGARRAFTFMAQDPAGLDKFAKDIPKARGLVNASATALSQTGAVKWAELVTQLKAVAIVIGRDVIPVFVELSKPISAAAKWFNNLSPSAQHLIATIGVLTSVGALLGGTLLAIVGGLASVGIGIRFFVQNIGLGKAGTAALAGELGSVRVMLALGMGIPAAIILFVKYHAEIMKVVNALGGLNVVLSGLIIVAGALSFSRTIASMESLYVAETAALTAATRLRLALLSLNAIGAIVVTVYVLYKFLKKILPGFNEGVAPGSDFQVGPQTLENTVRRDSQNKTAVARIRSDVRKFSPQYQRIFKEAEELFSKGFSADRVAKTLRDKYKKVSQLAIPEITADAGVLTRAIKRKTGTAVTAAEKDTQGNLVAAAAARNAKNLRIANLFIERLTKARANMLKHPYDIQAAKDYERIQNQLNKRFKDQPALLAAINDVLGNYDQNLKDSTNKTKTLGVTTQDMLSRVQSMYDNLLQKNQANFGTLFQGPNMTGPMQRLLQFGGRATGQDLVTDLRQQLGHFTNFNRQIGRLAERGAPTELINQLKSLGPEALDQIKALNSLPDSALRGYFKLFQNSQKAIHDQTMRDLRKQLNQYNTYGKNIALQIAAGLRSEQPAVENALKKMIKQMFPNLPTGATGAGGKATHTEPKPTVQHTHYHAHVTAPKQDQMSAKAQAQHAALAMRHKYTGRGGPTK